MDTSVWVRALSGKHPYRDEVDELLAQERVLGHDFVYGELLISDVGGRTAVLTNYALFSRAETVPHAEVMTLVRTRRLHGGGIGWIDAHLLASTLVSSATLYTADAALREAARKLGVAYAS